MQAKRKDNLAIFCTGNSQLYSCTLLWFFRYPSGWKHKGFWVSLYRKSHSQSSKKWLTMKCTAKKVTYIYMHSDWSAFTIEQSFPGESTYSTQYTKRMQRLKSSTLHPFPITFLIYFCILSSLRTQIIHIITDGQTSCTFALVFRFYNKAVTLRLRQSARNGCW